MKSILLILCALFVVFSDGAEKFVELKTEDKLKDKDLTFAVTFDRKSVNADFASGDKISTTMKDTGLMLRGLIGFDTQCAYQPESGEALRFNVAKNINPHQGTVSFWTAGFDYAPGTMDTDGKKRGNIALAHFFIQDGSRYIEFKLYEYADTVYFDWWSSEPPHGWGQNGRVQAVRKGIKKGEWHQIVCTWNGKNMAIYINGEKQSETLLPAKVVKTADLKVSDNPQSFIGIKSPFFEDKHSYAVGIDDFKIYSRPLSTLEVKNQYLSLLKDKSAAKIEKYSVVLNGVNIGRNDKIDRLEAEFDFSGLDEADMAQLKKGNLEIAYKLLSPSGQIVTSGNWKFGKLIESKILSGVNQAGKYTLETRLGKEQLAVSIVRPDFKWAHNNLGDADEVPEIWRDFKLDKRTVTLWNRIYKFNDGPLPYEITVYGKSLLTQAPQLVINGKTLTYQAGKTDRTNRTVTFNGIGKGDNFTLKYATTVEFDGLIKFDFTIDGEPEINSMKLIYQVNPENCQFLMTPTLEEGKGPKFSYLYPQSSNSPKILWLVSEKKGGFAFTMVNDANWVYDADKPVFFVDKANGKCEIDLITKKVKMPPATPYQALFIATPTRPLPEKNRIQRFGDGNRADAPRLIFAGGGQGVDGIFTQGPHETQFEYWMKNTMPGVGTAYGAANALTTKEPEAVYLRKYWDIPGAYSYKMPWHKPVENNKEVIEYYFSLSACNSGIINDFYLYNQNRLYKHPYGDRVAQVYYDLCGDDLCKSQLHGCSYPDKFGRQVNSFSVLNKRDLVRRTVSFAHKNGRTVMLHGQRDFVPMLQGMADYWFPGEQYNTLLIRNPYGYTDEVSCDIYRSEFNRNVLGVGVVHLPALGQASFDNFKEPAYPYTEGMLAMLQLHDVDTSVDWAASKPVRTMWDALEKYNLQSAKTQCHLYYEQKEITASHPDIKITYYSCPDNAYVLFIVNKEIRSRNVEIDISKIAPGNFIAHEEYKDKEIEVKNGKFNLRVPARSFRIVAFPPKKFYPYTDNFKLRWGVWKSAESDTEFEHDLKNGRTAPPALKLITKSNGSGCFLNIFKVTPGKTYTLSVWVKQSGEGPVTMAFQGRKQLSFLGLNIPSVKIAGTNEYQELKLVYTIPVNGGWENCDNILVTLGGGGKNSVIYFDDFKIEESDKK